MRLKNIIGFAALAIILALSHQLLRIATIDVRLNPDGSSVVRDRFTGDVTHCTKDNVCQKYSSTLVEKSEIEQFDEAFGGPQFRKLMDEALDHFAEEDKRKAVLNRASKNLLDKFGDGVLAVAVGCVLPIFKLTDIALGEPSYRAKQGWKGLWGARIWLERTANNLAWESPVNKRALNGGTGGLAAILFAAGMLLVRSLLGRKKQPNTDGNPKVHTSAASQSPPPAS